MMKKQSQAALYWWVSIVLLMLLGFSASLGGLALILDPSGATLGMNVSGLTATYFTDYETPGFILFFVLGILSLLASVFVMMKNRYFATFIFTQGALLSGWILVQVYMLPETHGLQLIYFLLGILLMLLGNLQKSSRAL